MKNEMTLGLIVLTALGLSIYAVITMYPTESMLSFVYMLYVTTK